MTTELPEFKLDVPGVEWLTERVIFMTYTGSIAYGTTVPESDKDIRGIAIPPPQVEHSLQRPFEQHCADDADTVIYSLKSALRGLIKQAPNMLELLFIDPKHYLLTTPAFVPLVKSRQIFLTKALAQTHLGAVRQLEKKLQAQESVREKNGERKPGFHKTLMHMVRYLLQANDMLLGREPVLERPEPDGLMNIRLEKVSVGETMLRVRDLIRVVEDSLTKSQLPERINMNAVDVLYRTMLEGSWDYEVVVPIMGNWISQKLTYSAAKITAKNLVRG